MEVSIVYPYHIHKTDLYNSCPALLFTLTSHLLYGIELSSPLDEHILARLSLVNVLHGRAMRSRRGQVCDTLAPTYGVRVHLPDDAYVLRASQQLREGSRTNINNHYASVGAY